MPWKNVDDLALSDNLRTYVDSWVRDARVIVRSADNAVQF